MVFFTSSSALYATGDSPSRLCPVARIVAAWLCCVGSLAMSGEALAAEALPVQGGVAQIDRYTVVAAGPTSGQRHPLGVSRAIRVPDDIQTVGEAMGWLLRDSGYRLAETNVLSDEAKVMLALPLPGVHRQFDAMPLSAVMGLIAGPAFRLVQDPVHRLVAFERCSQPSVTSDQLQARSWKP